jgi:hypothetical protein
MATCPRETRSTTCLSSSTSSLPLGSCTFISWCVYFLKIMYLVFLFRVLENGDATLVLGWSRCVWWLHSELGFLFIINCGLDIITLHLELVFKWERKWDNWPI